jgi:hypothetical protein
MISEFLILAVSNENEKQKMNGDFRLKHFEGVTPEGLLRDPQVECHQPKDALVKRRLKDELRN